MKKRFTIIVTALILSLTCFFAAACSGGKYGPEFEFENPNGQVVYDLDEGMTLDGKNDESVYEGNVYYETVSTDGSSSSSIFYGPGSIEPATVRFTTHFGEKGIYVYVEVGEQHIVRWDGTKKSEHSRNWNKTGISLYLCRMGETSKVNRAWELTLAADGESTMRKYAETGWIQTPNGGGYAVDIINGNLNENGNGTCDGYNMEVFMPWTSLDLEAKPETFMLALALIRHPNATGRTERLFEYVASNAGNPSNWIPFTENGMFTPPTPTYYDIDGDLSDWADYQGKNNDVNLFSVLSDDDGNYIDANGNPSSVAIAADVDTDERYVRNKMVYASDGLYVSTEALMRIYMTDHHTQWWRNSSVEMKVRDKNNKTRTLQFGANGYATSGTISAWKCEDTAVLLGDETLKRITHEVFLPKALLDIWGFELDDESIEANYAFRNGRYQPGDGDDPSTYTLDLNETKLAQFVGAGRPYIFYGLGSSPYSGGGYLKVTDNGITPATYADERYTLDGNATEWADYEGVHAVSMGRMGVDGDTTDVNKGFDLIARKGTDGLYFYATVKHADWRENDVQAWMSSNLALGFALTTVNHTNATAEFLDGYEFFFTPNGPSSTKVAAWMSDNKNAQRDADGLYTTVIEGFVPYDAMLSLDTTSDSRTNKVGQWSKIFNPETGEVKDGYALRLGVQWRTRNEIIGTQGRNDRADIQALDYWGVPVFVDGNVKTYDIDRKDCGWRMYYVSDSGIHTSKAEAKYAAIDGKADDWADYPTDAVEYKLTGDDTATSVSFKAMLREDGLYVLTTARMKGYLTGNAFEYNLNGEKVSHLNYASSQWYRNTNFEVFAKKSDGSSVKLAYVTPFTANNDLGDLIIRAGADVSWAVQKNGSYYDSVAEVFINAEYLKRALNVTVLPAYTELRFIYTTANLKGVPTEVAPANTDLYNGGAVWNNGRYEKTGYYGMFDELVEGSTSIEDAELEFIDGYDEQTESVVCNGMPWEIVSGVTLGGNKLLFGRDYVVTYQSNVDCGEAQYVVKGINAYGGEISGSFEIKSLDVSDTVSVEINDDAIMQSTGGAKPEITVTNGDRVLAEGEDYELSYSGNIYLDEKEGDRYKAYVTVTYVGMYGGTQPSTHEYTYKAFDGAHKNLDGAASAYAQAAGQEIAVTADSDTDGRGLWYKAQLTEEGLYIVAKARHNTLITLDNATDRNPWNSSHFEIRIGTEDSVRGFVNFADGAGASRDVYYEKTTFASADNLRVNTEGFFDLVVMRSTEYSGAYARETIMEAFMSKDTMSAYGIGADEWTRVSMAWKTNGENLNFKNGGNTSRWQYNGVSPDHLGVYVDETGIMSRMVNNGDGTFDNLAVLEKGYVSKSAAELTLDGNDNDWTDYNGYDIKVYARGTDEGKSLVFKAKLGDEGMYFFAENKHDILITDESAADNEASQLAFEFMLANKSEGTAYNGGMTFLSALGGTHVDGSVYIFRTVSNGTATPKYTTTIEGLIPWQSIIGGYINVDTKVSDDVIKAISPKTGLKDGWTLHFAVGFRTKGETYKLSKASSIGTLEEKTWIYQGYRASARPSLTATDFNAKPYQMFGVTEEGIDDITASYAIDGVADTTAGITSKTFTLTAANDTVFTTRPITHYARLTEEGLYYAMNVSTNHYDFATDTWWKNMSFKMRALKPAEASSSDNIELFTISGDGGCFGTDYGVSTYEWNIVENASYDGTVANGYKYNITLELFITRAAVEKKTGTLQSKLKICPEFVATNSNSGSYVLIDGKSGGQRWFIPALWEGANYNTASWFYVGANGIE